MYDTICACVRAVVAWHDDVVKKIRRVNKVSCVVGIVGIWDLRIGFLRRIGLAGTPEQRFS